MYVKSFRSLSFLSFSLISVPFFFFAFYFFFFLSCPPFTIFVGRRIPRRTGGNERRTIFLGGGASAADKYGLGAYSEEHPTGFAVSRTA